MVKVKVFFDFLKETIVEFNNDNLIHFSASLSFFIITSLPSIIYLSITFLGSLVGQAFVTSEFYEELISLVGKERAQDFYQLVQKTSSFNPNPFVKSISIFVLIFTSTAVFITIQDTLNVIWKVRSIYGPLYIKLLKDRVLSFFMTLFIAAIFIVLIILQALLALLSINSKEIDISMIIYLNNFISFGVFTFLFALIFKAMAGVVLKWKSLWLAAIVTSLFFWFGKFLLINYLATTDYNSTYGAGAVIVILLWIFYSSFILFTGAELLQVDIRKSGQPIILKPYIIKIKTKVINKNSRN